MAFIVSGLLLLGWLWPAGLLGFAVNVLDGVDGKLARTKALAAMALHAAITGLVYAVRAGLPLRRADWRIVGRKA